MSLRWNDGTARTDGAIDVLPVATATDSVSERFTFVHDVVEVDDSLVIVNDVREQRVWVVNFSSGSRAPFGSTGDGPGEYRSPASILRRGGDTIIIAGSGPQPRLALESTRIYAVETSEDELRLLTRLRRGGRVGAS